MSRRLAVGVIGCGPIGRRRASEVAANPRTRCVAVASRSGTSAREVASAVGADATDDWRQVVARKDVDAVVIATPNALLAEMTVAALQAGKHVLVEKPMGRNLEEAKLMHGAARSAGCVLKIGFDKRYHPAVQEARRLAADGEIGDLISIRCRFGHGARPGYEQEWRGNRELAGGGSLLDLGVHIADLVHWFAGAPRQAFAMLQTVFWPLGDLEDNAFGLFLFPAGAVAALHASWTQWKNLFSFEVYGRLGSVTVEGLGRSYGVETLILDRRCVEGGPPDRRIRVFEGPDESLRAEWGDFVRAVEGGGGMLGTADDGVAAMRMIDALYRSSRSGLVTDV